MFLSNISNFKSEKSLTQSVNYLLSKTTKPESGIYKPFVICNKVVALTELPECTWQFERSDSCLSLEIAELFQLDGAQL